MNTGDVHEIVDGSIRRSWHIEDFATALAQMDARPAPGPARIPARTGPDDVRQRGP